MKPVLAALASASLIATPFAAAAQHHGGGGGGGGWHGGGGGGGGWHGGGGGGWRGGMGGWSGGGWSGGGWHGGWGGWHGGGFHNHGCWGCFGGFAFGLALGSAWYPWYWDYPYYYPAYSYTVVYPDGGYYYDRYQRDYNGAAPAPTYAAPPSAACGQWQWDAGRQQYYWTPCAAAPPPPEA